MSETEETAKPKKGGLKSLFIGLAAALILGGGAGYGVYAGLIPMPDLSEKAAETVVEPSVSYVELDPVTVAVEREGRARQLRLTLAIETSDKMRASIEEARPRILDALNTLLRAIDERDLAQPAAIDRLRAQMLRRIRLASDATAISDLLIVEYVIF